MYSYVCMYLCMYVLAYNRAKFDKRGYHYKKLE